MKPLMRNQGSFQAAVRVLSRDLKKFDHAEGTQ
jgi:hypothetical protein